MTVTQRNLFEQVLDYTNRANPYPIYARMREEPVSVQDDGRYLVSTYAEVRTLLSDPRFSSDLRKCYSKEDQRIVSEQTEPVFLAQDPPKHDWMRYQVMSKFTPELISGLRPRTEEVVKELLDARSTESQLDIVDDFAYPLPVTIICELLGVPRADEPRFHHWTDELLHGVDPGSSGDDEVTQSTRQARDQLNEYMLELVESLQQQPRAGLLSAMLHDTTHEKRMSKEELAATGVLLLIAGHVTTVNLITNSMLTLLRHPADLEKLRREPERIANAIEEVLRYEPPVQFIRRTTLSDVPMAGVTIPKGAPVYVMTAAANRDPARFADPDQFDPERQDIEHFGFGGGIHYCVGAPLARLETHAALLELVRRLEKPQLVDPHPPYRESAVLRGPRHLQVSYERMLA